MNKLQNNHNVYILGAGFSAERGLPTIKDFMLVMRDAHPWLESKGRKKEADAIAKVLDFRLDAASAAYRIKLDLENIEELFSLASAKSRTLTEQIQLAIAATLDYKLQSLEEPIISFGAHKDLSGIPNHWTSDTPNEVGWSTFTCPAYEFFLKVMLGDWDNQSNLSDNSFITFNYDLLIENALNGLSIPFTYGIGSKSNDSGKDVEVLKLHGSVNWAREKNSTTSYVIHDSYEDLLKKNHIPQLVPPTWRKIFTGPLRQVWDRSLKSLEQATRIIVIGFSIPPTDNHFKYLIAAGLQNNISLREIVFVNPEITQIEERANNLFGDITKSSSVKVIGYTLSQFISIGPEFINGHNHERTIRNLGRPIPHAYQSILKRYN